MHRQTITVWMAASLAVLIAVGAYFLIASGPRSPMGTAAIGGPFSLVDQHGANVTDASLHGRLALIFFGFTFCPDVCPTELQTITVALDRLGDKADQVAPVFITLDPERDTPVVLGAYLKDFDPRLIGLTGTPDQIAAAARAFRVYYAKTPSKDAEGGYTVDHTGIVYLMGRDGRYRTHFSLHTSPDEMAEAIRRNL